MSASESAGPAGASAPPLGTGLDGHAMATLEEALRADAALTPLYTVPPEFNRTGTRIFSLGGGPYGAMMSHHGFSWMGLVAGAKRWYVAPPTLDEPHNPNCGDRRSCPVLKEIEMKII